MTPDITTLHPLPLAPVSVDTATLPLETPVAQLSLEATAILDEFRRKLSAKTELLTTFLTTEMQGFLQNQQVQELANEARTLQLTASLDAQHDSATTQEQKTQKVTKKLEANLKNTYMIVGYLKKQQQQQRIRDLFRFWKQQYNERKQMGLKMHMAGQHYHSHLLRRLLLAWDSETGLTWKMATEKRITRDTEKELVIQSLAHDAQVKGLRDQMHRLSHELEKSRLEQIHRQDEMRRSFLRGVSGIHT